MQKKRNSLNGLAAIEGIHVLAPFVLAVHYHHLMPNLAFTLALTSSALVPV